MKKTKSKKTLSSNNKSGLVNNKPQSGIQDKIHPLGSRVLIRPFTKEELISKNSFGIILPDTGSKEKSEQGLVLAVGPGEYQDGDLIKTTIKVGERVVFSKYGYEDISINGEELYLIKEENILAILK